MVLADSSGPAPLDDDDEKAPPDDEKGANNDESSTADAFFRPFQISETITSRISGGCTRASSIARRADVATAEKSPEKAQHERHQLLKPRALVRFENFEERNQSPQSPASIGTGLAPLPGAQTRRSPSTKSRDFHPRLISRTHVRFENAQRPMLLFSAPAATTTGLGTVPCRGHSKRCSD
jgi:hypothetical protein